MSPSKADGRILNLHDFSTCVFKIWLHTYIKIYKHSSIRVINQKSLMPTGDGLPFNKHCSDSDRIQSTQHCSQCTCMESTEIMHIQCGTKQNDSKIWQKRIKKEKLNTFRCHNWVSTQPRHPRHNYKTIPSLFVNDTMFEVTSWFKPGRKNRIPALCLVLWCGGFFEALQRCNRVLWPPQHYIFIVTCVRRTEHRMINTKRKTQQYNFCPNVTSFFFIIPQRIDEQTTTDDLT